MKKHLLITGKPGTGKTTLIRNSIKGMNNIGGFYTNEIRKKRTRTGFEVHTILNNEKAVLSHVNFPSFSRVGKYGVNVEGFETVIRREFESCSKSKVRLIIIDEIAKMEIYSEYFRKKMHEILTGKIPVLGVIQIKKDPFLDRIRKLDSVKILELTPLNRTGISMQITRFTQRIGR